ncbi:hypothetical protein [Streptosporangium lutulentum]|uniref:DUF2510 domain-containing protein n=1 Tax=Streptosporangium lutulentum TaxID=1461250 RepID=A0ABT9QNM5_9ACTN|nr:hypothetical protein [Streptosporangium lutulentum]MDP9848338.1 hypothetical protein [Streptosporangium lutulentum]
MVYWAWATEAVLAALAVPAVAAWAGAAAMPAARAPARAVPKGQPEETSDDSYRHLGGNWYGWRGWDNW